MPSVIATIKVKQDKIEDAKKLFAELSAGVLANEPGTLAYIPHQRKDEPATFIFYEKYQDMDAFKTHGANLAKRGKEFAGVMAGPPEIVMVNEVA
jgi:quinol monooxygenase YgiN